MRYLTILLLPCVGCVYGPEHLPALYQTRDAHLAVVKNLETTIYKIEEDNNITSRDLARREEQERIKAQQAAEMKKEAEAKAAWWASLTPDQKFQWTLEQEKMRNELQAARLSKPDPVRITTINQVQQNTAVVPYFGR